jgi:hypothetical protein
VRLLAACITLFGGVNLLEAAPAAEEQNLRPCTPEELCGAFTEGGEDCGSISEPGHNYCVTNIHPCGVDETGQMYYLVICTDYGEEDCPLIAPCG